MLLKTTNVVPLGPSNQRPINFEESIVISWLFALMQAFYTVLIIGLGVEFFKYDGEYVEVFSQNATMVKIFFVVFEVLLFPLGFWFYVKFWSKIVTVATKFFNIEIEDDLSKRSENLVIQAMSAHAFLILPFFGKLFSSIGSVIYLYLGLRVNLSFTAIQSLCVLLVPVFLVFISLSLMMFTVIMALAGF
jgi:hypothetical protein